jgi:uncharacterized protein (DUF736 family)
MDAPQASRKASRQDRPFTANADGSFSGAIRALALGARTVRIRSRERTRERGPTTGCRPIARAWAWPGRRPERTAARPVDEAADIDFGEPVNAALVVIDGTHTLVWSRSTAKAD